MPKSIMVPLDGSTFSEQALPIATGIVRASGAQLHLAQVRTPLVIGDEVGSAAVIEPESAEDVQRYLHSVADRLARVLPSRPALHPLSGGAVEALAGFVREQGIDLIVMTTHGRGPIARAWLGSIADDLARTVTVPLILQRLPERGQALPEPHRFRHVMIALDGTETAEGILGPAMELATLSGAEVTLVRVIELVSAPAVELGGIGTPFPDADTILRLRSDAHDYLRLVARQLAARSVTAQTLVVEHSDVVSAILEEADQRHCDLIALATHGRGGLARLVLGSVADRVVRGAHTAVLVYHPHDSKTNRHERANMNDETIDREELMTVYTTGDPNLARMVVNELAADGIAATVTGENQAGLSGILDVEVQVRAGDAALAKSLLERRESEAHAV